MDRADLWGSVSAFSLSGQTVLAALYRWGAETGGVFCLPAEHEPFGMAVIEAMAVGLPVVATSNGGPREITNDGEFGLLADPTDPTDIACQLLRLLDDPEMWQDYARRGLERVLGSYNWRQTAEGYLRLIERSDQGSIRKNSRIPIPDSFRKPHSADPPRLDSWTPARPGTES
jgi:sucrose-phosphate synthase